MQQQDRTVERVLARISRVSYGVVTREQVLAAGITEQELRTQLASGGLIRVHPGVYRVGHEAPSVEATYLAAVWACGEGALLHGDAAAHLYQLIKGAPPTPRVLTPKDRKIPGVLTTRTRTLHPLDATTYRGIPTTTVPRVLVDLAKDRDEEQLGQAWHQARVLFDVKPSAVEAVLARRPNSPGIAQIRHLIHGDAAIVLSKLEKRFLQTLESRNLPIPVTNRRYAGYYVDCRWPGHGLVVELDSYRFHSSRRSWEQGHRREMQTRALGNEFRRYTYADVFEDPALMLADLRGLLL